MTPVKIKFVDAFTVCAALTQKKALLVKGKAKQSQIDKLDRIVYEIREQMGQIMIPNSYKPSKDQLVRLQQKFGKDFD